MKSVAQINLILLLKYRQENSIQPFKTVLSHFVCKNYGQIRDEVGMQFHRIGALSNGTKRGFIISSLKQFQIIYNNLNMFYLVRNLKTCLIFTPYNMDKLSSDEDIIKMLREKMEGLCFNQYGYIVRVYADEDGYTEATENEKQQGDEKNENGHQNSAKIRKFIITTPEVEQCGIKVYITFSAICFKAQKNDLVLFKVANISQASVMGYIGPAEVIVPKSLLQGFDYRKDENIFVSRLGHEKMIKIDRGSYVKAKCISSSIQMNDKMKIVAEVTRTMSSFIENDTK